MRTDIAYLQRRRGLRRRIRRGAPQLVQITATVRIFKFDNVVANQHDQTIHAFSIRADRADDDWVACAVEKAFFDVATDDDQTLHSIP